MHSFSYKKAKAAELFCEGDMELTMAIFLMSDFKAKSSKVLYTSAAEEIGSNGDAVKSRTSKLFKKLRENDCMIESTKITEDAAQAPTTPASKGSLKKRKAGADVDGTPRPYKAARRKGAGSKNKIHADAVETEKDDKETGGVAAFQ